MSNLANLGLNDNDLQGTIPPELGNLTKLSSLIWLTTACQDPSQLNWAA